jgi:short-subunit dehydrogenase
VLGATSAIARAAAAEFARAGHPLVLAARDEGEARAVAGDLRLRYGVRAETVWMDATDFASHGTTMARAFGLAGAEGVDGVLLAVAGQDDPAQAARDALLARRLIDATFTGCASLLTHAGAAMEAQGRGWICGISSVAGDRGRPSNYVYGAAKAGLTAFLEGLRGRLHPAGVRVVTVKPGFVDTRLTFGRVRSALTAEPAAVARGIRRAVEKDRGTVYLPWFWRPVMFVIRVIPGPLFKRLRL